MDQIYYLSNKTIGFILRLTNSVLNSALDLSTIQSGILFCYNNDLEILSPPSKKAYVSVGKSKSKEKQRTKK